MSMEKGSILSLTEQDIAIMLLLLVLALQSFLAEMSHFNNSYLTEIVLGMINSRWQTSPSPQAVTDSNSVPSVLEMERM